MNWIDIALILPIAWMGFKGFKKGIILEVFSLIALIAGIYGGLHFSDFATEFIASNFEIKSEYLPLIAFSTTFILVVVLVYYTGKLLEKVIKIIALNFVNKILGACFGLLKSILIMSLFLLMVESADRKMEFLPGQLKSDSLLYEPILGITATVFPMVKESKLFEQLQEWWKGKNDLKMAGLNPPQ